MKYEFLEEGAQEAATFLNLSQYGAISICYFPDWALKKFKASKPVRTNTVKDPLRFYIYILNQFVADNNIELDITKKYDLMNDLGIHGGLDEYLPEDQREKPKPKVVKEWPKPKCAFEFSPINRDEMDDVAEAIKLVGYVAAGINGTIVSALPTVETFVTKAYKQLQEKPDYTMDLPKIMGEVNTFIDRTVKKWHPELDEILCKKQAAAAILEFIPKLPLK